MGLLGEGGKVLVSFLEEVGLGGLEGFYGSEVVLAFFLKVWIAAH